jgi:NitT/TauT family transport system substrate-binding protein
MKRIMLVIVVIGIIISGCVQKAGTRAELEKVTIGLSLEPVNWLTLIAVEKKFFTAEGLEVTVKEYPSGKRALIEGLFAGEVDVTAAADVPIVFNSFERQDFSIFATVGSSDNQPRIIARKDKGIQKPDDLLGKNTATQEASAVHFFLHLFLMKYNLPSEQVELSFKKAEELPEALASGEIDAFSMREPFISQAKDLLGDNFIIFAEPGLYVTTFNLVAYNDFIENKPEAVKKLLLALMRAEDFAENHSDEAIRIISNKTGVTESDVTALWPDINLKVSLQQALIITLESEARWLLDNKLTNKTEMPNYLDYIVLGALHELKPEVVNIIH